MPLATACVTPCVTADCLCLCVSYPQVMQHMSKCFQAIDKLKLDNESPPPGQRPKALGMVSSIGEEYVGFKQPLPLEDKASSGCRCCFGAVLSLCVINLHALL